MQTFSFSVAPHVGCARRLRTHVTVTYGNIKGQHYVFCSASCIYISRFRSFLISLIVLHFAIHVHFALFLLPHLLHPWRGLEPHPPLPLEGERGSGENFKGASHPLTPFGRMGVTSINCLRGLEWIASSLQKDSQPFERLGWRVSPSHWGWGGGVCQLVSFAD